MAVSDDDIVRQQLILLAENTLQNADDEAGMDQLAVEVVDAILNVVTKEYLADEDSEGPESTEPQRVGHPDNPEPSPDTVRAAYRNLVTWMNGVNALLPPLQRSMVPYALQDVLRDYIDQRETIDNLLRDASRDTPDASNA